MGYICNLTVIATICALDTGQIEKTNRALDKIRESMAKDDLPNCILGPTHGANGYFTFIFAPDGSKEGWDTSNLCDIYRQKFIKEMEKHKFLSMVTLQSGGDDGFTKILETTDGKFYDKDGLEDF